MISWRFSCTRQRTTLVVSVSNEPFKKCFSLLYYLLITKSLKAATLQISFIGTTTPALTEIDLAFYAYSSQLSHNDVAPPLTVQLVV